MGKTTLARDVASEAAVRGVHVLGGACYDLTNTPPYGAWVELFDSGVRRKDLPSPPTAFLDSHVGDVTDQASLFAEVHRYFTDLAASGPTLLLLEDLHWADPDSLHLLRHLAPRLQHWPILLIATYREDELTHDHPFAAQLPALVREASGLRIDLRRLDRAALHALVAARYPLPVSDETRLVTYLDQHGQGNPFFTTELLRALQEEALLRPTSGGWTLDGLERVVLPAFLRHVIEGRVDRLGEATRQSLAMAAVIGQDVPLALWAQVADLDDEVLLTMVERAVGSHLLEAHPDGQRVRFVHALTREALYVGVMPPRRRRLHRRVGEALAAEPRPNQDAVAYHFQAAGDPRAGEWLIAAGDRAQRAYAWLTAAERLRAAAALLEDVEGQERTRGRLACRLAYLLRFSDPDGAMEAIEVATRLAGQIGDATLAAEVRWLRGLLLCYADRFREGLTEMFAGIASLETVPATATLVSTAIQAWFAEALPGSTSGEGSSNHNIHETADAVAWRAASIGRFLASAGHVRAAAESCERSVSVLTADAPKPAGGNLAATAFAAHGLAIASAGLGRPDEARTAFAQARAIFTNLDHHALVAFTLLDELHDIALTYGAARPRDRRWLATAAEAALEQTGGALRAGVSPRLAWLGSFVLDGRWQEADQILHDLPDPGNAYFRREITAAHVFLAYHRGDSARVWEAILGLLPDGPATEPGDLIHQEGLFLQALAANLCLDAHDVPGARAWLMAHDDWVAWSGSVLGHADGKATWARYHWLNGNAASARAMAEAALTLAMVPDQPLVRLAVHRLLGQIETATKNYALAEGHLMVAHELSVNCDAPFEQALTLLDLAELRLASGSVDMGASLLEEARKICDPLGAAPALTRVNVLQARLRADLPQENSGIELTPRELEVLRLLPLGLSNAEIATILFVSPRTVQTHLSNLYAKLAVSGRAEAVAYAVGHGLT
jgi:DNA-binding CsgD family transcriptional regulator/tetratricopeptide (TPR) repeat protein